MKTRSLCLVFATLSIVILRPDVGFAGWMANADFSACPRSKIPNTSGSEGPFNLESECLARVRQVEQTSPLACAKIACVNQQAAGGVSASAPAAPGHEMDEHISKALSAGIQGKISATDTVGLVSLGVLGNALLAPNQPQQPKSAAELEADRVAAEKAAIESLRRQREREEQNDARVAPMLALLDPLPSVAQETAQKSSFYSKGYEHASQCISQNAGPACAGVSAEQMQSCLDDYRAGYDVGSRLKTAILSEAFQAGLAAGSNGELANAASDSRSVGPCRTEWIENYNRGHFQGKNEKRRK